MSTFDWPWSPNSPPNSTRNISGKTIAKNTDALSRMNPRTMARLRAREGAASCSCAVLPSGEGEEDVLEGAGLHLDAGQGSLLGQRGRARRRARGCVSTTPAASSIDLVDAGDRAGPPRRVSCPAPTVIRVGASRPRTRLAGRVELEDPAVVHDRDPVAQRLGLVHVVRGQHDRAAAVVEPGRAGPTGCAAPAGPGRRSARRGTPPPGRAPARRRSTAAAPARRRGPRPACPPCRPGPPAPASRPRGRPARRTGAAKVRICSRAVSRSKNAEPAAARRCAAAAAGCAARATRPAA